MKKVLIILVIILVFGVDVYAAEIIVDGISYNANKNFEGDGYSFNSSMKTLYLDGYNGGRIEYTEKKLTISVANNNYINGINEEVGLKVMNANIYGSGSLNIINSDIGILAEEFRIQNIDVLIMTKKYGIKATTDQVYLANMNILIKNSEVGVFGTVNFFLQNTTMNIINCDYGIKGNNLDVALNSSKLYVKTNDYCLSEINKISVVDGKAVFKSNLVSLNDKYIVSRLGNVVYVSDDRINYFKENEYHYYPIVKVSHQDNIEELLFNENSLLLNMDESFIENDSELDDEEDNGNNSDGDNSSNDDLNDNQNNNKDDSNIDNNINNDSIINDKLDVLTKNEYTDNEYTDSEFDRIEIVNPNTFDNLNSFIVTGLLSLFIIISILFFRRENE